MPESLRLLFRKNLEDGRYYRVPETEMRQGDEVVVVVVEQDKLAEARSLKVGGEHEKDLLQP